MGDPGDSLLEDLCAELPAELGEVLVPALTIVRAPGRIAVASRDPSWHEVLEKHAAATLREAARARGLVLSIAAGRPASPTPAGAGIDALLADPGNQLAFTACRRAVAAPGLEHNPLYLHGPAGCGKSALLAAVAHDARTALGPASVVEFAGDSFVASEAQVLAERGATPLRNRLDQAILVVFDDVHRLSGRALAQEELFHLIDRALERGQQVVVTGDQAPRRLELEERLRTRLGWVLAVEIETPQLETRIAALHRLAGELVTAIPSPRLADLVERLAPDFHQVAHLARTLESGADPDSADGAASLDRILNVVATRHSLRPADLVGRRRTRDIAHARHLAMWLARRLTPHTLIALGAMLGGRDHATVIHAVTAIEARRSRDAGFRRGLDEMVQEILGTPAGP